MAAKRRRRVKNKALAALAKASGGPTQLAGRLGVSGQTVHSWINGMKPTAKQLLALAAIAGIDVDPRLKKLAGLGD